MTVTTSFLRCESLSSTFDGCDGSAKKSHRRCESLTAIDWQETLVRAAATNKAATPKAVLPMAGVPASPPSSHIPHLISPVNVMAGPDTMPGFFKDSLDASASFESLDSPAASPLPNFGSLVISVQDIGEQNDSPICLPLVVSPIRRSCRRRPVIDSGVKPPRYNLEVLGEGPPMDEPPRRIEFVPNNLLRCQSEKLPKKSAQRHRRDSYASLSRISDLDLLKDDLVNFDH